MPQDQKKLPWFKFTPNEWLTGNIVGEDMCCQGLFINICAYYWKEGGSVPLAKIERRYGKYESFGIIKNEYLNVSGDVVNIGFLDEQLNEIEEERKNYVENGKKGAEKRWGVDRGAINGLWPNIADKDIDIEKEKEKEYTSASLFEKSGKRLKLDPRVSKAVKKLNASGDISLDDIEERFFKGMGTQSVIEDFQAHFASIGYGYKSDQGIKTVFMSWENQLKQKSLGGELDKKSVPVVKMTPALESTYAKFEEYRRKVGFLADFLCQESPQDRSQYYKSLIQEYGIDGAMKKIAAYSFKAPGGSGRNFWRNFQVLTDHLSFTEEEWRSIKDANNIVL